MNISNDTLKEIVSFATTHKAHELNHLLSTNDKYAFALEKCISLGYICGISTARNALGIPVFQELEGFRVTDNGLKFLKNSSLSTDL